jgi:hypothetical protein
VTVIDSAIEIADRGIGVTGLRETNDQIAEMHLLVVGRAVRMIDQTMRDEDVETAHAITTTATLVPELSGQIADAIGGHLSSRWGLDVGVDSYTAAELDLCVAGPFEPSQIRTLMAFIGAVSWWPSKVSIMFDRIMAIDAATASQPDRLHAAVRALVTASSGHG